MPTLFDNVNERRHELLTFWVSRIFLMNNTARMLRGIKATRVRALLHDSIGDCNALARCKTQGSFDALWHRYVAKLGKTRRVPFGQAAKLVNLYIKAAIMQRGLLTDRQANAIRRFAHVPIDSLVQKSLWSDFCDELKASKVRRNVSLKRMERRDYYRMQQILRDHARNSDCVPLDYDFAYLGPEKLR